MGYEVDFLAVGDGEKSGDAIALRFGNLHGSRPEQCVVVIDAGTMDSGDRLVDHIESIYHTRTVDIAISTHPDGDHCSGLFQVVDRLNVRSLWMHQPWNHAQSIRELFNDGRVTHTGISDGLREDLQHAHDLEQLAIEKGVRIFEPFSGLSLSLCGGSLTVLGPPDWYYEQLLLDFEGTPEPKEARVSNFSFAESIKGGFKTVVNWVRESWGLETLEEPDLNAVTAENNSSVVLLVQSDAKNLLFTGDAGVPALDLAADYAEQLRIDLTTCSLTQIPHHGSRRNVGPSILNRIVGSRVPPNSVPGKRACVSAAANGAPKHPAKKVTNAYIRRGAKVLATQGRSIRHFLDAPDRYGWGPVEPVPFYQQVEE